VKIQDFNDRLKDSILIADGAMGSMLYEAVGSVRCFDELNATEPEAVFAFIRHISKPARRSSRLIHLARIASS